MPKGIYERKVKTPCKRGHARTPENVDKWGSCRICKRTCGIESVREWKQANPDKVRGYIRKRRALNLSQLGLWNHMETQLEPLMYQSQEGKCYYCGDILDWENRINSPLEHMTPLTRGGSHGFDNWCISCRDCNLRKHAMTAEEFIATSQVEEKEGN